MQIGYARVSTTEQNLESQIMQLKEVGCEKIYQEKISGARSNRPELDKLLENIREGDTLVVCRLSRLGRSIHHTLKIIENLKQRNIALKFLDFGIDTRTTTGSLIINIILSLVEYERESICEQARAGIVAAKAIGKHLGRPQGPDKEKLKKALYLVNKGASNNDIASILGCSRNTVIRYKRMMPALSKENIKKSIVQQNIFGGVDLLES